MRVSSERLAVAFDYLSCMEKPMPEREFRNQYHFSYKLWNQVKKEFKRQELEQIPLKVQSARNEIAERMAVVSQEDRNEVIDNLLYKKASNENATKGIIELYCRLHGLLIERKEEKIQLEISAADHRKIEERARRRLQTFTKGAGRETSLLSRVQGMPVLSEGIRVVDKQEHSQDN